jgi:sugar/nucleoside kinase (ribokinase family)
MNVGGKTNMLGQVGKDADGAKYLEHLDELGVCTDHISEVEGVDTGMAYIFSDVNSGDNSIVIVGGANMNYGTEREYPMS